MILNRLAQGIRRQDWGTVILELVIVVVGILLALQVDNWNEERKARHEAKEWRVQIIGDLQQNQRDLQGRLEYSSQALAFGEHALASLQAEDTLSPSEAWDTLLAAFQAGQIWPYRLTGPTFRQVQNAGGLGLLGDPAIVNAIAYFYDVSAYDFELVSGGLPKYRDMIREHVPWSIQNHIWNSDCQETYYSHGVGETNQAYRLVQCLPPSEISDLPGTVETLRKNTELINALRGRLSQLKVGVGAMERRIKKTQAIISQLNELLISPDEKPQT